MVVIKLIGIIVAFQIFIVREAFAQNFYPARYGKRDENEFRVDSLMEGKRLGRSDDQNTLADRKIRFFISGGRYGKRGCSQNKYGKCSEGPGLESESSNNWISLPVRKNQFVMGSRFGKRFEGSTLKEGGYHKNPWCMFTTTKDYYKCSSSRLEPRFEPREYFSHQYLDGVVA